MDFLHNLVSSDAANEFYLQKQISYIVNYKKTGIEPIKFNHLSTNIQIYQYPPKVGGAPINSSIDLKQI